MAVQKTFFEWAQPGEPGVALASEARKDQMRSAMSFHGHLLPHSVAFGRPPLQQLYEERLYSELMADNFGGLARLTDSIMPGWWKPKSPLRMPLGDVGAAHHAVAEQPPASSAEVLAAWAEETPVAEPDAASAAAAAGTESAEPPSKKTKTDRKPKRFVPREAQVWFLTWTAHMKRTRDYSERQCWAIACKFCPEVFAKADLNTFKKWHPVEWEALNAAAPGRKAKLSPGTVQELQVVLLFGVVFPLTWTLSQHW